jgi:hypothetical protein
MQRRIAKTFLQQALHTARAANFFRRGPVCPILGTKLWASAPARGIGRVDREKTRAETSPRASPSRRRILASARPPAQFRRWTRCPAPHQPLPTPFPLLPPPLPPSRRRPTRQTLAMPATRPPRRELSSPRRAQAPPPPPSADPSGAHMVFDEVPER